MEIILFHIWTIRVRIPPKVWYFLCSKSSGSAVGPNQPPSGYRGSFVGVERPWRTADRHLHLEPTIRTDEALPPFPHTFTTSTGTSFVCNVMNLRKTLAQLQRRAPHKIAPLAFSFQLTHAVLHCYMCETVSYWVQMAERAETCSTSIKRSVS